MERMEKEQRLMDAMQRAGEGIGSLIRVGKEYEKAEMKKEIYGNLTEYVMSHLGDDFTRESVNYAEVLGFTGMVSEYIKSPQN